LDFGQGFYTTTDSAQAAQWASRFSDGGEVLTFQVRTSELNQLNGLNFTSAESSWEKFVLNNRAGGSMHGYDMVSGPMLGNPRQVLSGANPIGWGQQTSFHTQAGANLLSGSLLP